MDPETIPTIFIAPLGGLGGPLATVGAPPKGGGSPIALRELRVRVSVRVSVSRYDSRESSYYLLTRFSILSHVNCLYK